MRANRGFLVFIAALLLAAACSGDDAADTTAGPVTTTIAAAESTTAAPGESTTTAAGDTTTTTSGTDTTTTTVDGSSSTTTETPDASTTTAAPATSSTTTTTGAPSPAVEAQPATPGCPGDLFVTTDDFGELSNSVIAAFTPPTLTPIWEIPLGYDYVVSFASGPSRVFVLLASGTLIAIDVEDCAEAWRADVGSGPVTGGVEVEDNILVVTAANKILAFDTGSGNQLWSDPLSTPAQPPLLREGIAVAAGQSTPWIRSYWMPTGERLFNTTAGFSGPIEAIEADFDAIYIAGGGKVEGRWIDDGTQLFDVPSQLNSAMVIFDIFVYVAEGTGVAALDFDTGEQIWANQLDNRVLPPIGIGPDFLLVFDETGRAHRLDFDTGVATAGGSYGAFKVTTEFDDSAFLVADDGTITAYNLFEEAIFELPTGADGISRFTQLEVAGAVMVTNTFSAERF
jgi:outer membrane protein assembly factor BamB